MKNIPRNTRLCLVIALFFLAGCENEAQLAPQQPGIAIGALFPELELVSLSGESSRLSDFRGKLIVLNIWATWCPPCRKELPSLESLGRLLGDEQFVVLGLSIDEDPLIVREYLADKDIRLPVVFNAQGELDYAALGINVFPYTFIILPDGSLAERYPGEKVWNSADVVQHLRTLVNH